jgi:hypothetical protein
MFSVDDPVMRHNWTVSLKRQIDIVSAGQQVQVANTSSFHRAAEQVAFRVLQETLIPPPSAESDNRRFTFSNRAQTLSPRSNGRLEASGKGTSQSSHVRLKSCSQVYHRHGPGKLSISNSTRCFGQMAIQPTRSTQIRRTVRICHRKVGHAYGEAKSLRQSASKIARLY